MFGFSGVWDATMERRVIAFLGIGFLLLIAYLGALASHAPIISRLFI